MKFKLIPFFVRIYPDGTYKKLAGTDYVPAGIDPSTGVQSKDVVILPHIPLSVRLYIPKLHKTNVKKLPLVIFFHGGGFITESAGSPIYQTFLNLVGSESNVVIVSVDYRTAPEHPFPACFDDSWETIKWVAKHQTGNGPEQWLNDYADFGKVFFLGDSAGANIAHHMAVRFGSENPGGTGRMDLQGLILLHPFFWGKERVGSEADDHRPARGFVYDLWKFVYPGTSGEDDPLLNPDKDPKMADFKCPRVLIYVAEKDTLKNRGWFYKEILAKNGWRGDIEVIEDKKVNHVYFLMSPLLESARKMRTKICTFINGPSYSEQSRSAGHHAPMIRGKM